LNGKYHLELPVAFILQFPRVKERIKAKVMGAANVLWKIATEYWEAIAFPDGEEA